MSASKLPELASDETWTKIQKSIYHTAIETTNSKPRTCHGSASSNCTENWGDYVTCSSPHPTCDNFNPDQPAAFEVRDTPGKGQGLFATADIPPNTFVIEYIGEIVDATEMNSRVEHNTPDTPIYHLLLDDKTKSDKTQRATYIDASNFGNESRFANHSEAPNCSMQSWSHHNTPRQFLVTNTLIRSGTELTYNYYPHSPPPLKLPCRCGASNCSGWMGRPIRQSNPARPKGNRTLHSSISPPQQNTLDTHINTTLDRYDITDTVEPPNTDPRGRFSDTTVHKWLTSWARTHDIHYDNAKGTNPQATHWVLSSFFYTKLTGNGPDFDSVANWSRRRTLDLQHIRFIHIPIHLSEHWILVTLDTHLNTVTNYDSIGQRRTTVLHNILSWWTDIHKRHLGTTIDTTKWKTRNPRITLQNNDIDCGVHMLHNLAQLTSTGSITTSTIPYTRIRSWIALTINPTQAPLTQTDPQLRTKRKAERVPNFHLSDTTELNTTRKKTRPEQLTDSNNTANNPLNTPNTADNTLHEPEPPTLDHDMTQTLTDINRHQAQQHTTLDTTHIEWWMHQVRTAANNDSDALTPTANSRLESAPIEIQIIFREHSSWIPRPALLQTTTFRINHISLLSALARLAYSSTREAHQPPLQNIDLRHQVL